MLSRVNPAGLLDREELAMADAHLLTAEVDKRAVTGDKPLSLTKGGADAFHWGVKRSQKAGKLAVAEGLLEAVKKGRGNILTLPNLGSPTNLVPLVLDGSLSEGNQESA